MLFLYLLTAGRTLSGSAAAADANIRFIAAMEVRAARGKQAAGSRLCSLKLHAFQTVVGGGRPQPFHAKGRQISGQFHGPLIPQLILEGVGQSLKAPQDRIQRTSSAATYALGRQ